MATQTIPTIVQGREEVKDTFIKKTGYRFIFFKVEWWEVVKTDHIGNDIYIITDRPIRKIFFNGREIK